MDRKRARDAKNEQANDGGTCQERPDAKPTSDLMENFALKLKWRNLIFTRLDKSFPSKFRISPPFPYSKDGKFI